MALWGAGVGARCAIYPQYADYAAIQNGRVQGRIDRWALRRSFLSVSSPNQRSTWFNHDE